MRSIFCSSAFSSSRRPTNVWADCPTLPFHCLRFEYSRCNQAKSSCHLLPSANQCVRPHLSVSEMSARVGISEDIRKTNQEFRNEEKTKQLSIENSWLSGFQINSVDGLLGVAQSI